MDALKQAVAQLTQERDRLLQQSKAQPRKEVVESAAPVIPDRAALTSRLPNDPPLADAVLEAIEAILKEQGVRVAIHQVLSIQSSILNSCMVNSSWYHTH